MKTSTKKDIWSFRGCKLEKKKFQWIRRDLGNEMKTHELTKTSRIFV